MLDARYWILDARYWILVAQPLVSKSHSLPLKQLLTNKPRCLTIAVE
jgi:hypothetical protein